jgi:hypothetical protein
LAPAIIFLNKYCRTISTINFLMISQSNYKIFIYEFYQTIS